MPCVGINSSVPLSSHFLTRDRSEPILASTVLCPNASTKPYASLISSVPSHVCWYQTFVASTTFPVCAIQIRMISYDRSESRFYGNFVFIAVGFAIRQHCMQEKWKVNKQDGERKVKLPSLRHDQDIRNISKPNDS